MASFILPPMARSVRTYDHFCSLARTLERVGDRWALLVVRDLLGGPRRFTDLMARLGGITPKTLTQRLRELAEDGVVPRVGALRLTRPDGTPLSFEVSADPARAGEAAGNARAPVRAPKALRVTHLGDDLRRGSSAEAQRALGIYLHYVAPEDTGKGAAERALRRAALKKMFTDPHFNTPDPFEPFSGDWTVADPIPDELMAKLNQVRTVLFPDRDKDKKQEAEQQAAQQPPAGEQAKAQAKEDDEPGRQDA